MIVVFNSVNFICDVFDAYVTFDCNRERLRKAYLISYFIHNPIVLKEIKTKNNREIDDIGGKMMMNEEEARIVRLTMLISCRSESSKLRRFILLRYFVWQNVKWFC